MKKDFCVGDHSLVEFTRHFECTQCGSTADKLRKVRVNYTRKIEKVCCDKHTGCGCQ